MKAKNVVILCSQEKFSDLQLQRLSGLGKVTFIANINSKVPSDTEVLVVPFASEAIKAKSRVNQLLELLPDIKYLVLGSSDFGFINVDMCKTKGITISYISQYDSDSKAEHTIAIILSCMRRIIVNDRATYRRRYDPEMGHDLKGSVLGIIGLDHTGEKVAELAKTLGAVVYIWDNQPTPSRVEGTRRQSLEVLLHDSDVISLHLAGSEENKKFLNKERIKLLKDGVMVVNLSNRSLVNEYAMNEALKNKKVDTYAFEAESIGKSPLKNNNSALVFKPFSTNTKETQNKSLEAMVRNVEGIVRGMPYNRLNI